MKILLHYKFFRNLLHIILATVLPTLLNSQPLIYESGCASRPEVLGVSSVTRNIIDLAGKWDYSLDGGITWSKVKIPSAFDYSDKIIFRRKFKVEPDFISQFGFKFIAYGISYASEIFINENFIGKHEGGYTSFSFSIPENVIQAGEENVIRIVVNNSLDYKSTLPLRQQVFGWKNYAGIFRDIFITTTPRVWIDNAAVKVESIESKLVVLRISASIFAKNFLDDSTLIGKNFSVSAEAVELSTGMTVNKPSSVAFIPENNRDVPVQFGISIASPKLWTPETPELYSIKITLSTTDGKNTKVVDQYLVTTGIRTVSKDKTKLLLNGVEFSLRGVVWIEDSKEHGSALTYEEMEKDVALIKNLGANAVRIGFHPPHPFFIQLCNRYGLFVLQEIPLYEVPGKIAGEDNYAALAKNYLMEMIRRDKNNPSIIAWGLGEDVSEEDDKKLTLISDLHAVSKSIDDRFTYYVSRSGHIDASAELTDIAVLSLGRIDVKKFKSFVNEWRGEFPNKPVFIGGYKKEAEPGNHNGYSDPMSQESQARYLLQRYNLLKECKINGSFIFTFNDWRSDRPLMRVHQANSSIQTYGIVELDRKKKTAYDVIRSAFLGEKISALTIGTYVHSSPYIYVVLGLVLLIILAWFLNTNRRFQENVVRAFLRPHNFYTDIREQRILPIFHTAFISIIISATYGIVISSILHHYRSNASLDYAISHLFPDIVKQIIIKMAWDPALCIGYITALLFVWFFLLSFGIKLLSFVFKVRIYFFNSYSVAVWSALPFAVFLIVAMILFRIMESEPYVLPVLSTVLILQLWIYIRTLKGISVIFNRYPTKIYILGFIFLIISAASLYGYYDYTSSFSSYVHHFVDSIAPFSK